MDDAFVLKYPEGAQNLLKRLRPEERLKGQKLYNTGQVRDLTVEEPGYYYSASVFDGEELRVSLDGDSRKRWWAECDCEKTYDCEHVAAALLAILAEHRTTEVRKLSAGLVAALGQPKPPAAPKKASLEEMLVEATGRALRSEEKSFVRNVQGLYRSCAGRRTIGSWDLQSLGLSVRQPWGLITLWPSFPKTEHEFWLYLVHAVREDGGSIPQFMLPVSDTAPIEPQLQKWLRRREIQKWEQVLSDFQGAPPQGPAATEETDVRLVMDAHRMELQIKPPKGDGFVSLKATHFRQLLQEHQQGLSRFTIEGELLWQLFTGQGYYGPSPHVQYDHPEAERMLNRMLRLRTLESRICNPQGEPLQRVPEPLRWELTPATNEEDDYRLRLVKADGSPAPEFLAVVSGNPGLFVTSEAVYMGPDPGGEILDPKEENAIPAPALERAGGIALLDSLGVPLPERIQRRIERVPYQVAITCELKPSWYGADKEDCYFTVQAEATDGHQQAWTGQCWLETTPRRARKKAADEGSIRVYDTAFMQSVPTLLQPLNLKPAGYGDFHLALRVNKKFPEVFSAWLKTVPPSILLQLKGDLGSFLEPDVAGRVKLDVSEVEIDWFDLQVVLDLGDTTLTAEEIKLLLNAKGKYVRLKGKGWKRLQYDLTEDENEKLARLGLSARELSAEPQRLHALQLADDSARKFLPEQQVEQIQRRASEIKARVSPDLPAGVTAQLRPYQLEGFHFLAYLAANRFGGILADDMGLGKTLQTLGWLLWLREQYPGRTGNGTGSGPPPALVVCPKSVMDNWRAEAARFTPSLRVKTWPAAELSGFASGLPSADLHVLNYSQLRTLGESLGNIRWLAAILDEGQYIKNPNSQTAQVARSLRADYRLVLSGTPIENRLLDLWSLMAYSMPGVLGSRAQFARLYDAKGDPFARRRLASRVRPFVLRRTKAQVARDLPDRIEEDLFCELEGEQQLLYRAELKRAQQLLLSIQSQKELAQQQFHFLTSLLRLRQICCHPRLVNTESKAVSAKSEALLEQLEPLMEEGQKVLVFSQFVEMLNLLEPGIRERGWPVFFLAGHTENRGELVDKFQSSEGPGVFLISLKAGGFGLNLTAASYVVLFDPWWNPAVENQAIDRTHRIGQTNKVIAYRLLIKSSVEEKIRELQKKKRALAEDVLGEEKFAQSLTLDDLRFLFSD